ncbi:hypothetical protein [Streptomyces sp. ID05-18]|uniref:hypothetical protein n=1 Tax=Streptomyces sp. ID05-18 TaxID=3028662 RepID=UPI0029A36363|nr:hypothetical protein [Streptomyces sp. ID05-18]MDX3488311.1 hypothetical protein [Streptomyces sp. ID05-18]
MRVRLTDGTREVDINTGPDEQHALDQIEATALRLLTTLDREQPVDDEQHRTPIGFTPQPTLDGVALSADTERSDQDARPERYSKWGNDRT